MQSRYNCLSQLSLSGRVTSVSNLALFMCGILYLLEPLIFMTSIKQLCRVRNTLLRSLGSYSLNFWTTLDMRSSMFLQYVSYVRDYREAKNPRSMQFISRGFGGWLLSHISSPICHTASANCSSSVGIWVRALSCCIHIILFASPLGHFA
jgi:hypothetical protein